MDLTSACLLLLKSIDITVPKIHPGIEAPSAYQDKRLAPPSFLDELISHFYMADNRGTLPVHKILSPTFQHLLIFSFGAPVSLHRSGKTPAPTVPGRATNHPAVDVAKCLVIGPFRHALQYTLPPGTQILVVSFKADGFFRLFGQLPDSGTSILKILDPDQLVPAACFSRLWETLAALPGSPDQTARLDYLIDYCRPYIHEPHPDSLALKAAIAAHEHPVKAAATETGKTKRHMQQLHKQQWGFSAKEFQRFSRFIQAVRLLEQLIGQNTRPDWPEIIHECGYYDQSQLIHDFRHYMGLTPTRYIQFQKDICNPLT